MTTRIDARFAELKKQGRSAFITFLMAGTVSTDLLEQAATQLAEQVTLP